MQQNFLSPTGFRFTIKRLPNVTFFVQSANIPGLNMGVTASPTPHATIFFGPDKLEWGDFTVTIRLDEYMEAYNEIFNWMVGLAKPASFDQYRNLQESEYGLYSDASLIVLDSRQNPGIEVTFQNMFPIALSEIELNTTEADISYRTCTIVFKHNGHKVTRIG
jgi:hypothetical protein